MTVRTTYYRTIVYDEKMYVGNGTVARWVRKITAETETAVRAMAPPNRSMAKHPREGSGALERSIGSNLDTSGPKKRVIGSVKVGPVADEQTSDYVKFVLGGTGGQGTQWIYSHEGFARKALVDYMASAGTARAFQLRKESGGQGLYMGVRAGAGYDAGPRLRVKGQRANNFLQDGYNQIAATHRSLKPMRRRFVWRA